MRVGRVSIRVGRVGMRVGRVGIRVDRVGMRVGRVVIKVGRVSSRGAGRQAWCGWGIAALLPTPQDLRHLAKHPLT